MTDTARRDALRSAGITRSMIDDAITEWRNGATYDALHPLRDSDCAVLWDDNAIKDMARVIMSVLCGETPPRKPLPWNDAGPVPDGYYRGE